MTPAKVNSMTLMHEASGCFHCAPEYLQLRCSRPRSPKKGQVLGNLNQRQAVECFEVAQCVSLRLRLRSCAANEAAPSEKTLRRVAERLHHHARRGEAKPVSWSILVQHLAWRARERVATVIDSRHCKARICFLEELPENVNAAASNNPNFRHR